MRIDDYIEYYNAHGFDVLLPKVFNNLKNFLRVVAKKGRQAEIELGNIDYSDVSNNDDLFLFLVLLFLLESREIHLILLLLLRSRKPVHLWLHLLSISTIHLIHVAVQTTHSIRPVRRSKQHSVLMPLLLQ